MPCYHPLKGFIIGKTDNDKNLLKITPYDTECVFKPLGSDTWEKHGYVLNPMIHHGKIVTDYVQIPCGQCVGCRLEYSRQWAIRCMLEASEYDENYFLTLTYNDDNVPTSEYIDDDGVIQTSFTLVKKDLQKFCKDLRSHLHYRDLPSFRFYACGEYGDRTARPHYHMIAFGLHLDDLKLYKKTDIGNLYTSEFLSSIWKKGYVIIGGVTFESCAYVSRYIMKKQKGDNSNVYSYYNILPEFTNMSRRPGIGKSYFESNYEDIYPNDKLVLNGGRVVRPPRFFDRLMSELDESLMEDVKLNRQNIAEDIQSFKLEHTSVDYQELLQIEERNAQSRLKKLVRPLD